MIIWTILATAAAVSVTGLWIAYRRQVKQIGRKLTFLEVHRTNMSLTSGLPFSELNGLIDSINCTEYKRNAKGSKAERG